MAVDNSIFKSWLHLLPMDRIKSRSSSFSILSRWMIYVCSATISLGSESLRGLPFFRGTIPALSLRCRSLYRDTQLWTCEYSMPSLRAISRLVIPSLFHCRISFSYWFIFVYFLGIAKPPRVVLLSYTGRFFVYCLLFTDLFNSDELAGVLIGHKLEEDRAEQIIQSCRSHDIPCLKTKPAPRFSKIKFIPYGSNNDFKGCVWYAIDQDVRESTTLSKETKDLYRKMNSLI